MPASSFLPTVSVCIYTCDHPKQLRHTLQSVADSTMPPHQLIVTDDSSGYDTREMMRRDYPDITYLEGPRRSRARQPQPRPARGHRLARTVPG